MPVWKGRTFRCALLDGNYLLSLELANFNFGHERLAQTVKKWEYTGKIIALIQNVQSFI
jgi:hypothetical protein